MRVALDVIAFAAGALIVLATVFSAIKSTILPRAAQSRITNAVVTVVRATFRLRAKHSTSYADRDRIMAMLGPIALLAELVTWLVLIMVGYGLMYGAISRRSVGFDSELSGASIFTLGTTSDNHEVAALLTYSEAALGLLLVALLITYLPSIYTAFSRRENGVSLLEVRAGSPPQATTMLIRYNRIEERRYQLRDLWRQWEEWFTDVEESHTTFPILVFFRSPLADRSWITAAGALLDGASFWAGCIDHPIDPDVQLCIRAGYLALRRIADVFRIPYNADPEPDDPITITRDEWDRAMAEMAAEGIPLRKDREAAWRDWRGWRVNYESALLQLARLVEAPLAPWESDRSPITVQVQGRAAPRATGRRGWRGRWPRTPG